MTCVFCNIKNPVLENEFCKAFFDQSPVSNGHLLIVTIAHRETYFDLMIDEKLAVEDLLVKGREYLDRKFHPDGYNIGVNCGKAAGQTIPHCHVHLIPRYVGDTEKPRGSVRGVIPEKQGY